MRKPPPLILLFLLLLPLTSLLPRAARAAQVVVLEPRARGDLRSEERARLGDALWAALDRLGLRRVSDADRDAVLQGEVGLRACLERDECLERLGRLLEAAHVIGVSLERTAPGAHKLSVRLFDVDVGQDGAVVDWTCAACSVEDVARQLDGLVEAAVQKDRQRPRGVLVLRSTPPNADVQIDGRRVGFTELERPIFAGPHEVVVSRLGLSPEHLRIDIGAEQRLLLSLSLNPPGVRPAAPPVAERTGPGTSALTKTPDPDGPQRPRRSYVGLGVGIPLTLLGLGGVGLGVTSLLLDGTSPAGDSRVYNTRTLGYIEIGVGAAVAAVGIGLIAWNVARLRTPRPRAQVLPPIARGAAAPRWPLSPGRAGIALSGAY